MKRLVEQLDGVLARQAAALAGDVKAGLQASLDPAEVVRLWNETHRDSTEVTPKQARDWAVTNVRTNNTKLSEALDKVYSVGGALGYDASLQAYAKAKLSKAVSAEDIANAINIDWATWKPGSRAAAIIAAPRGGFARLLNKKTTTLQGLDTTTLRQVGTALSAGLALGLADEDIASKLVDVIGSAERALTIATTEMNSAMSIASMDNYQSLGVEQVEWLGLEACEICQPNIDQGAIPWGQEFDSGDTEPPGHANCRCSILPVIEGLDDNAPADGNAIELSDRATITKFVPDKSDMELALARLDAMPETDGLVFLPFPVVAVPEFDPAIWEEAALEVVALADLVGTSPLLKVKKVRKHIEAMGQALKPYRTYALVIEIGGSMIIIDGHHRLMSQWLLGLDSAPVWKVVY
jgi:hypothetical protein